jgi:hypothetical protein
MALGTALALDGRLDEGLELLDRAMPPYLASGTRIFVPLVHARLAQAMSRLRRFDEAASQLARATMLADEYGERWLEPVLSAVGTELELDRGGDVAAAARALGSAEQLAVEQGAHGIARSIAADRRRLIPGA